MMHEEDIAADAGKQSAALGHDIVLCERHKVRGRGHRTKAEGGVQLLSMRGPGQGKRSA